MSETSAGIFHFLENLVTKFTWRRLLFVLCVLFLIASGVILYEAYTGHFRLDRMARSAELLEQLQKQQDSLVTHPNPTLSKIHEGIADELQSYVGGDRLPFHMPVWFLKALASIVPWVFAAFILILTNDSGIKNMLGGVLIIATPLVFIGAVLPCFRHSWINYFGYPIGSCLLIMIIFWRIGTRKPKKANKAEMDDAEEAV